jgi:hypothetical protein
MGDDRCFETQSGCVCVLNWIKEAHRESCFPVSVIDDSLHGLNSWQYEFPIWLELRRLIGVHMKNAIDRQPRGIEAGLCD